MLDALGAHAYASIEPYLIEERLAVRTTICTPGTPPLYVTFPVDAIVAEMTDTRAGIGVETRTIGNEGLCGTEAVGNVPMRARWSVQMGGRVVRVSSDRFMALYAGDASTRTAVARYVAAALDGLAQTVACNRSHFVAERCARWILTIGDRVGSRDFPLTHEALAITLGVRRAGVSTAAADLQRNGSIRYRRGRFHIADRDRLEAASCSCYRVVRTLYERAAHGA